MDPRTTWALILSILMCNPSPAPAQVPAGPVQTQTGQAPSTAQAQPSQQVQVPPAAESLRPTYVLGAGDVIQIRVVGADEIGDRPYRVEANGEITLPLVGAVKAAGLTLDQFQSDLNQRFRTYFVNPQVLVTLIQFRSEPVFFIGAFKGPGIYPLQGRRTLVEMISIVGGLAPTASRRIRITRRKEMGAIPLPNAVEDPDGKGMTVEIPLNALTQDINPPEDISLMPYDVVSAEKAELVYLSGEVMRPGGYELGEKETLGVLQLVSMAGGPSPNAALERARILRSVSNTPRRAEIPINLKDTLKGKGRDVKMMAGDVLYVPRNSARIAWGRVLLIAVPLIPTLILIAVR